MQRICILIVQAQVTNFFENYNSNKLLNISLDYGKKEEVKNDSAIA